MSNPEDTLPTADVAHTLSLLVHIAIPITVLIQNSISRPMLEAG